MKRYALWLLPLALAACSHSSAPGHSPASAATAPAASVANVASAAGMAHTKTTVAATSNRGADMLGHYHWRLVTATNPQGQRIDTLFADAEQPLQIDFRGGRLVVSHTCNHMSGSYRVVNGHLVVGSMAQTRKACPDSKLMSLDKAAGRLLHGKLAMTLTSLASKPRLTLVDAGGNTLVFTGHPTAQTRFGGKGTTVFMEVAAQTVPCKHPPGTARQCLKVRTRHFDAHGLEVEKPGSWHPLEQPIEGYTHVPGVRNVLRLKRYTRRHAPGGATSTVYVLDMVIESEPTH